MKAGIRAPWRQEAVVRSFQPGSATGPSDLRPQHLLDCLNSADSAAKAGLRSPTPTCGPLPVCGVHHPATQEGRCSAADRAGRYLEEAGEKVASGVRPGPKRRRLPCPAPNGVRKGEPLQGRGHGSAGPVGRPAREHGVAPAAGGPDKRVQLHCAACHPGGPRAFVPLHDAMGAASVPAHPLLVGREVIWSTRAVQLGDPWAPSSSRRASRQSWTPCPRARLFTDDT